MLTLQIGGEKGAPSLLLDILWAPLCQYTSLYEQQRWSQSECEQKWVGSHPLFSGEGQNSPNSLLTALSSVAFAQTNANTHTCKHAYTWKSHCCCLSVFCFVKVHGERAMCFSPHLFPSTPPPPTLPFTHCHSLCLCLSLALSLALFFSFTFSPPHASLPPSLPPVFYLTSLLVVLVCELVCHEGGGGWLVVGGLDGHLILALPHNVGMCNLFKIRFPRWVLSLAMVSMIMRVYTVVLLSLPPSLCLLYLAVALLYMNLQFFLSPSGGWIGGGSNSSKSLQAMVAVHVNQQVTVKCQTALE